MHRHKINIKFWKSEIINISKLKELRNSKEWENDALFLDEVMEQRRNKINISEVVKKENTEKEAFKTESK